MRCFCMVAFLSSALSARSSVFRTRKLEGMTSVNGYTYKQFSHDFGRSYKQGSVEYQSRLALFQASVERIAAVNARNVKEGRTWLAGVHQFMDWSAAELKTLHGYKPSRIRSLTRMTALQTHASIHGHSSGSTRTRANTTLLDSFDSPESP